MKVLSLEEIKNALYAKTRKEKLSFSGISSGIPLGAITSVSGSGKTEFVIRFLTENPSFHVAWIEDPFSAFPYGFLQRKIKLSRVLFIDAHNHVAWTIFQVLKSQIFRVVVIYVDELDENTIRRIQLMAERSETSVLWLTSRPKSFWCIALQVHVQKNTEAIHFNVLRKRF